MDYIFYIRIEQDGLQSPRMEFASPFQMLCRLGNDDFSTAESVESLLNQCVLSNKSSEKLSFASNDFVSIELDGDVAVINSSYEDFESFTIAYEDLHKLLSDWLDFLKAYEGNKIPGLTYNAS
jgi:hypothetical protein